MESTNTLIDKALKKCDGSGYRLAKTLGEDQSFIGKVARGQKKLSAGLAARIAAEVGDDPREAALATIVEAEEDPEKQERLAALFGMVAWRKR